MEKKNANEKYRAGIGNNRFLTASIFKNEILIHIREYRESDDVLYPTTKGIAFPLPRWASFVAHISTVDEAIEQLRSGADTNMRAHIGGRCMISVKTGIDRIDVRKFWMFNAVDGQQERPTRSGIALNFFEWGRLKAHITDMHAHVPEAANAKPCYDGDDHANQLGFVNCLECNPFTKSI